jgi:hypothetical protein
VPAAVLLLAGLVVVVTDRTVEEEVDPAL